MLTVEDQAHLRYLQNLDQFSPQPIYVWPSQGLWWAERGGLDPSETYCSIDRYDVLEQVEYDENRHTMFDFAPLKLDGLELI